MIFRFCHAMSERQPMLRSVAVEQSHHCMMLPEFPYSGIEWRQEFHRQHKAFYSHTLREPGGRRVTQAPPDREITCRSGRLRSLSAVLMRELRPSADSATWMAGRQHCRDFQVPAPNSRASSKSATKLTPVQVRNSRIKVR